MNEEVKVEVEMSEVSSEVVETPVLEAAPDVNPEPAVFDLDVDFENYSVPEDRAAYIRRQLSLIKERNWLGTLCDWVQAEGQAFYPYGEQSDMNSAPSKRIHWEEGHALAGLEIIYDGLETEIRIDGKKFLGIQKLPKGDEVLLSHFEPEFTQRFSSLEQELHANLKVYTKAKSERQKAFQERFKKSSS